jgi:hypothetical protein
MQSTPSHPVCFKLILILSSRLPLWCSQAFQSNIASTFFTHACYMPRPSNLGLLIALILFRDDYKLCNSFWNFFKFPVKWPSYYSMKIKNCKPSHLAIFLSSESSNASYVEMLFIFVQLMPEICFTLTWFSVLRKQTQTCELGTVDCLLKWYGL